MTSQHMVTVPVDFNASDGSGHVLALLDVPFDGLVAGARVLCIEGAASCEAVVVEVEDDLVRLELDRATWNDDTGSAPSEVTRNRAPVASLLSVQPLTIALVQPDRVPLLQL